MFILDAPGATIATIGFAELQTYDIGRLKPGSRYGNYPQASTA